MHPRNRLLLLALAAGLTTVVAEAQQSGTSVEGDTQTTTAPTTTNAPTDPLKKKPKKVWTEDDLKKMDSPVSVVGGQRSLATKPQSSSKGNAKSGLAASYKEQLRKLQTQLDDLDKKLAELHAFNGDNSSPSGGLIEHHHYGRTPVADQIAQLEEKRKQILSTMEGIEDQARRNGIEPGALR